LGEKLSLLSTDQWIIIYRLKPSLIIWSGHPSFYFSNGFGKQNKEERRLKVTPMKGKLINGYLFTRHSSFGKTSL